ncbi:MAG: hypothetical protein BAW33_06685 [Desulfobacterales bacterium C00003104]|nr:MAG: hypothetical protein BAW33_06685 [Desulfobacterales bacterium C00003104]
MHSGFTIFSTDLHSQKCTKQLALPPCPVEAENLQKMFLSFRKIHSNNMQPRPGMFFTACRNFHNPAPGPQGKMGNIMRCFL